MTYAEKTHLLDDDAADALLEYARALSLADSADTVSLQAIDSHGNQVEATFLLTRRTSRGGVLRWVNSCSSSS